MGRGSRWEDDGLADHLAVGVRWNIDSVASAARSAAYKGVVVCRGPTSMADIAFADFA